MPRSKRSREGYLDLDYRSSPGVSREFLNSVGLAAPSIREGHRGELATYTCSHCQTIVLINPMRTRPRNWCSKCDHYICDSAACNAGCNPFAKVLDDAEAAAHRRAALSQQMLPNLIAEAHERAERLYTRAVSELQRWELDKAIATVGEALVALPGDPRLLLHRGLCHMLAGRWPEGWRDKDEGYRIGVHSFRNLPPELRWNGESVDRLYLLADQGAGDEIMMWRYLPWVAERAKEVRLLCHQGMGELMGGYVATLEQDAESLDFDHEAAWCYLGRLPLLHKTTPETVPAPLPYLREAALAADFELPHSGRKRIGLCWAGHARTYHDQWRSMPPECLRPLLECDADFYAFQPGVRAYEPMIDLGPRLTNWQVTAAALVRMDAVVTVDTAVAHLAGSLGLETHMLASRYPVWIWPKEAERSPWYPTMRIHWQKVLGDWPAAVLSAKAALGLKEEADKGRSKGLVYHSGDGQDRWLAEGIFKGKRNGVFVEFGALDGLAYSNTLYFEREMGWTGMLAEANPYFHERLVRNRPDAFIVKSAIAGHEGAVEFDVIDGPCAGLSGLSETMEPQGKQRIANLIAPQLRGKIGIRCITLKRALLDVGLRHIDYLSIDVEGAEWDILQAFPFDEFDIDVIGLEDNWQDRPWDEFMASKGYVRIGRVGTDNFYRRAK